jgi:ribosomal protein S18
MAQKKQQPRRRTGPQTAPGKRKSCHFCRDKVAEIDYKNLGQLRRYI